MKAGQITGPRKIEIIDVPVPEIGEKEVQFKIEASCLCGSDAPLFRNDFEQLKREGKHANTVFIDYEKESMYPMNAGFTLHECVGTVTDSRSSRFKVGDFVLGVPILQHGFFQYLTLPEERIYPMPRGVVSNEEILMSQPLGTILFGFRKLPEVVGKTVVVVGQGPIGLLMDSYLIHKGAREVIGIDKLSYRCQVGKQMGATKVIDNSIEDPRVLVEELTEGAMADIVIEAAGHHELAIDLAVDLVARDGHVLQFGVTDYAYVDQYPAGKLFFKNASLHNSVGACSEKDFVEAAGLIGGGVVDVKPLLTHSFKLDQVQRAYETYADRLDSALKVLLDFS